MPYCYDCQKECDTKIIIVDNSFDHAFGIHVDINRCLVSTCCEGEVYEDAEFTNILFPED